MNSLYELDTKWRNLLTSSNFLGGLTVNEFVEELSKDQFLKGSTATDAGTWKKLDPKPYIRTFESILKELKTLSDGLNERKNILVDQVSNEELRHADNVVNLFSNLKVTMNKYDELDGKLSNVIQVISPLGDKVETSIRKKKVYIKSVELVSQYHSFSVTGKSDHVENLLASPSLLSRSQAVIIVKNLLVLARKIETSSIPKSSNTTKIIEKYSESMENNLLENFNTAYRENNFTQLNEIAMMLDHFNGGVNVIQSFINQHEYFISTDQLNLEESNQIILDNTFKNNLLDEDLHTINFETTFVGELDSIELVIKNESKVVKRVFEERASYVIQLFIQRIFVQKIETKISYLLSVAFSLSDLAHIRMLHALYSLVGQFVKDLTEYFKSLDLDQENILTSTLEQCYMDIFSQYLYDRSKYFDIERRSLESILIEKTSIFNISHEKETHFRALANKFNNKLESGMELNELRDISRGKMNQINNFFKTHLDRDRLTLTRSNTQRDNFGNRMSSTEKDNMQQEVEVDHKEFNISQADAMLKCVVESIARVMELTPHKASTYSYELLELMNVGLISSYVETALEIAYYEITKIDITHVSDINISFLEYISISTEMLSLVSASIKAIFLPLLNNYPDMKKKITDMTNNQIKRCELLINTVVSELMHLYASKFNECLSKQKKKDFTPKSQDLLDQDTLPAIEVANLLTSLYSQASLYFKPKNLISFLTMIGELLYNLLLSHYGKFQVSSIGGIIVTKDIIGYQNAIDEWEIPEISDKFATLRELANLFTVQPELLDSLTKEGHLVNINRSVISTYISKRDDFNHEKFMAGIKLNFRQHA